MFTLYDPCYVPERTLMALLRIREKWRKRKVYFGLHRYQGGSVMFSSFENLSGIKGNGSKALTELCKKADQLQTMLVLWTNVPKLHLYYERHGFERWKGVGTVYFRRVARPLASSASRERATYGDANPRNVGI